MIYTSYFANLKNIIELNNTNIISIAGKSSDEFVRLAFKNPLNVFQYKKLAPKYWWWKEWHDNNLSNDWYIEKYNETVLSKLNPEKVYNELTNNNERDAVLLCWESKNRFCHRHLVSNWIEKSINIEVKEL